MKGQEGRDADELNPTQSPTGTSDIPRVLLEAAVEAFEGGGEPALQEMLVSVPDHAGALRRKVHGLAALGLAHSPKQPVAAIAAEYLGRFRVLGSLGAGAMGFVQLALDEELGREVAIKSLAPAMAHDAGLLERFRREARAIALLSHPSIVPLLEIGEDQGQHFLVVEYVPGVPLDEGIQRLRDLVSHPRRLTLQHIRAAFELGPACTLEDRPADVFARWIERLARALAYAHERKIVHRDVKPSNVIIDRTGQPRLFDFGLAQISGEVTMTLSSDVVGTARYLAPEIVRAGAGHVDERVDVFSLGAVLHELLTLESAFQGKNTQQILHDVLEREVPSPSRWNPSVGRDLDAITTVALAKNPGGRYQSALGMADDLRRFLALESIHARSPRALERFVRLTRRRPALVGLVGTLGVLMIAVPLGLTVVNLRLKSEQARAVNGMRSAQSSLVFLRELLELSDVEERGPNVTAREILSEGAIRVRHADAWDGSPLVRATVARTLGGLSWGIDETESAEELLTLSLAVLQADVPEAESRTAWYGERGRAGNLLGNVLRSRGKHRDSVSAYKRAASDLEEARRVGSLAGSSELLDENVTTSANLARVLLALGDLKPARRVAEITVKLARGLETNEDGLEARIWALLTLGNIQVKIGEVDESSATLAEAHRLAHELPLRPVRNANLLDTAAQIEVAAGRPLVAAKLFQQELSIYIEETGPDSRIVGETWCVVGTTLHIGGNLAGAEEAYLASERILSQEPFAQLPRRARALVGLAVLAMDRNQIAEAIRLAKDANRLSDAKAGSPDPTDLGRVRSQLLIAEGHAKAGAWDESRRALQVVIDWSERPGHQLREGGIEALNAVRARIEVLAGGAE